MWSLLGPLKIDRVRPLTCRNLFFTQMAMISQSELPSSLNIPSLVPSSLVLAKYLWPPLPPTPHLFTTPWAGAVGSLIDSTFFFSTPYYSSSTFNSSFFICFSIQHVIFQKKKTFSSECNFRRKWKFCI